MIVFQGILLVAVAAAVLSLGSFLLSLTRHHQGLNLLVNGNRFRGLSRIFGGVSLVGMSIIFAASVLTKEALPASFIEWAIASAMVAFPAITGLQLMSDGTSIARNHPR